MHLSLPKRMLEQAANSTEKTLSNRITGDIVAVGMADMAVGVLAIGQSAGVAAGMEVDLATTAFTTQAFTASATIDLLSGRQATTVVAGSSNYRIKISKHLQIDLFADAFTL
jgi:hypothetical protein